MRELAVAVSLTALIATASGASATTTDVGLVDPSQGMWHLIDADTGLVTNFFYGNPGDVPFMGDWDCDGTDTPGLFRLSDAFAYLRNSNSLGIADIRFFFGNPSDVPLAGDFNGDGCDTLSLYRPSEQRFYIVNKLGQNEGGLGPADYTFDFGNPGDTPFVGDFDGDGIDEVGLHRSTTGLIYFEDALLPNGGGGTADHQFIFGDPGDRFVAGDWNGNAADSPALFRPSDCNLFFKYTNTQGNADRSFGFGQPDWLPVAGNFSLTGGAAPLLAPCAPFQANYLVTFQSTWSSATHPFDFPPGPHFSGLLGAVHDDSVTFWQVGELASIGIERMAELGSKNFLTAEVNAAIATGKAGSLISAGGIGASPGSVSVGFSVNLDYPLVTIVSMLAPSPDWFVGVSGLSLFEGGAWSESAVVTLWAYDAGTDSGPGYLSPDDDTDPAQPITKISEPPVGNGVPVGQFTFTLLSTSS